MKKPLRFFSLHLDQVIDMIHISDKFLFVFSKIYNIDLYSKILPILLYF